MEGGSTQWDRRHGEVSIALSFLCFRYTLCLSIALLSVTGLTLQTSSPRFSCQLFQVGSADRKRWQEVGGQKERRNWAISPSPSALPLGPRLIRQLLSAFPGPAWQPWLWLWQHHILSCPSSHEVGLASALVILWAVLPSCLPF